MLHTNVTGVAVWRFGVWFLSPPVRKKAHDRITFPILEIGSLSKTQESGVSCSAL